MKVTGLQQNELKAEARFCLDAARKSLLLGAAFVEVADSPLIRDRILGALGMVDATIEEMKGKPV